MLVAEKQLLDANLRNELQLLRRMELKMMVNRYQNVIPAATMIGGFTFTGVVEMDLLDPKYTDTHEDLKTYLGFFHLFAALALCCSVFSLSVASIAIILGQRLAIQATAQATVKHEKNVKELNEKFKWCLFALMCSLIGVVGATICAIWARAEGGNRSSVIATCMFGVVIPLIVYALVTLNYRLNDNRDESSSITLTKDGPRKESMAVSEFRIGDKASIPSQADIEAAMGVSALKQQPPSADERSALLKCMPPMNVSQSK